MAMDAYLEKLLYGMSSLAVFRGILEKQPVKAMYALLRTGDDALERTCAYATLAEKIYEAGEDLTDAVITLVLESENLHIKRAAAGEKISAQLDECVQHELEVLGEIAQITPEQLAPLLKEGGFMPKWRTHEADIKALYARRVKDVARFGYGIFAHYSMFYLDEGEITPVRYPDPIRLDDLIGYKLERGMVEDNTMALLEGKPAQNALLRGDAGTGKSSTVKALVNEYADRGLRLIEIKKEQLRQIPALLDELSTNPLKFIIFIDDLSFSTEDDDFGALKAMLEGSVAARAKNTAIYATSNRRHLIRESFSDRDGDDVHRNDTMQQLLSLSARFGLKVTFSRPDKKAYLEIVNGLAQRYGLDISPEKLAIEAEAFALAGSGRSARTAKQFIESKLIEAD